MGRLFLRVMSLVVFVKSEWRLMVHCYALYAIFNSERSVRYKRVRLNAIVYIL